MTRKRIDGLPIRTEAERAGYAPTTPAPVAIPLEALKPMPGLAEWADRQTGRWRWCDHCYVCILATSFEAHQRMVHPREGQ